MRRAILAAGIVLVVAGLGGCGDQSVPSCGRLTADEQSQLRGWSATHAGKAENDAGWVVAFSPTLYDEASHRPRDFLYQEIGGDEEVATFANMNSMMPPELHATAELARLACSTEQ